MKMQSIRDNSFTHKKVLLRVDMNVPMDEEGTITSESRIIAAISTIKYLALQKAKLIIMTHLGRPEDREDFFKTDRLACRLGKILGKDFVVKKVNALYGPEVQSAIEEMSPGDIVFLENLRFDPNETKGDLGLAKELAKLGDCYVNDAFSCCHRNHASITGIPDFLPSYAGFQLEKEVLELDRLLEFPSRPFILLQGGAKVSSKIGLLKSLLGKVDKMLIGGGMAFTFLRAQGYNVGKSPVEEDKIEIAQEILQTALKTGTSILLPPDFVVTDQVQQPNWIRTVLLEEFPSDAIGVDIGPRTISLFKENLVSAQTILFNGPMGIFEKAEFSEGTRSLYSFAGDLEALYKVAAGGDTAAAIEAFGFPNYYSYISMGGGATLSYIEGNQLPGIDKLIP